MKSKIKSNIFTAIWKLDWKKFREIFMLNFLMFIVWYVLFGGAFMLIQNIFSKLTPQLASLGISSLSDLNASNAKELVGPLWIAVLLIILIVLVLLKLFIISWASFQCFVWNKIFNKKINLKHIIRFYLFFVLFACIVLGIPSFIIFLIFVPSAYAGSTLSLFVIAFVILLLFYLVNFGFIVFTKNYEEKINGRDILFIIMEILLLFLTLFFLLAKNSTASIMMIVLILIFSFILHKTNRLKKSFDSFKMCFDLFGKAIMSLRTGALPFVVTIVVAFILNIISLPIFMLIQAAPLSILLILDAVILSLYVSWFEIYLANSLKQEI